MDRSARPAADVLGVRSDRRTEFVKRGGETKPVLACFHAQFVNQEFQWDSTYLIAVHNGFAYQLITSGDSKWQSEIRAAAPMMLECFSQLDPHRKNSSKK